MHHAAGRGTRMVWPADPAESLLGESLTSLKETTIGMSTATGPANDPQAATLAILERAVGEGAFSTSRFLDNLRLFVSPWRLLDVLRVLKDQCGFALPAELGGADYLG